MSAKHFGRVQKATAIVPLAVLSVAWTASLAGVNGAPTDLTAAPTEVAEPSFTVPTEALEGGASVSQPDAIDARGSVQRGRDDTQQIVATSSTNAIPSAALAAYQRAETIINAADTSCNITWQLVAAIGRVESDHGRFGGSVLDDDGVAQPGIVGIPLDGTNQTSLIRDTDGGRYDNDTEFDRAVGPMQFIPDTWASVGVDADNDGQRNPQDIDDAALGTAVYLCSGDDDLSTLGGQRDAVFRYNNSESYVDLVLAIAESYLDGDFSAVPNDTVAAGVVTPVPSAPTGGPTTGPDGPDGRGAGNGGTGNGGDTDAAPGGGQSSTPPSGGGNTGGNGGGGNGGGNGGGGNDGGNTGGNGGGGVKPPKLPPLQVPDPVKEPVVKLLTEAEARVKCLDLLDLNNLIGLDLLNASQEASLQQCILDYSTGDGKP